MAPYTCTVINGGSFSTRVVIIGTLMGFLLQRTTPSASKSASVFETSCKSFDVLVLWKFASDCNIMKLCTHYVSDGGLGIHGVQSTRELWTISATVVRAEPADGCKYFTNFTLKTVDGRTIERKK